MLDRTRRRCSRLGHLTEGPASAGSVTGLLSPAGTSVGDRRNDMPSMRTAAVLAAVAVQDLGHMSNRARPREHSARVYHAEIADGGRLCLIWNSNTTRSRHLGRRSFCGVRGRLFPGLGPRRTADL